MTTEHIKSFMRPQERHAAWKTGNITMLECSYIMCYVFIYLPTPQPTLPDVRLFLQQIHVTTNGHQVLPFFLQLSLFWTYIRD